MISLDQALQYYRTLPALSGIDTLPLSQALGYTLARPLRSQLDLPPMRQSAMDGYAIHREDLASTSTQQPLSLPIHQESAAGDDSQALPSGHCARIFTGAPVPAGADAVEIQENVTRQGDQALFSKPVMRRQNIRAQGEELSCGEQVLAAGTRLDAQNLSIAANAGHGHLACRRKTRIGVIVTGNELAQPGQAREAAQVYDCNGPFLRHFVAEADAQLSFMANSRDDLKQLTELIAQALGCSDVLFVTGGASVGDHDHSRAAAQACGVEEHFWKVAQKPGKPVSFGHGPQGQTVLIMPGNPASVYVAAMVHARPILHALQGRSCPQLISVRSEQAIPADQRRERLIRASLRIHNAQVWAVPLAKQASHMNSNLAHTQAILRVAAGQDVAAGAMLQAWSTAYS